jgi:hypothetical protein
MPRLDLGAFSSTKGSSCFAFAKDTVVADELTSADQKTSESVPDFVLGLGETSTI